MATRTKRPPLVEVTWLDAMVDSGQFSSVEDVLEHVHLAERHTSGYLVYPVTDEEEAAERAKGPAGRMYIAQDFDPPHGFATVSVAPILWVTRVRRRRTRKKP